MWIIILMTSCCILVLCDVGASPCESNGTLAEFLGNVTSPVCNGCASRCGATSNVSPFSDPRSCSCDTLCLAYRDCCVDYKDECPVEYEQSNKKPYGRSSCLVTSKTYLVISSCPQSGAKCNRTMGSAETFVPVYDPTTQVHYINYNCALCNHANQVIPWTMTVSCDEEIWKQKGYNVSGNVTENEFPDIWSLFEKFTCSSILSPEKDITQPRLCQPVVNKCKSRCDNKQIKQSCEEGALSYIKVRHELYSNIGCVLCNKPGEINKTQCINYGESPPQGWDMILQDPPGIHTRRTVKQSRVSFSMLFDMTIENPDKRPAPRTPPKRPCLPGQIWMPNEGRCKRIVIPPVTSPTKQRRLVIVNIASGLSGNLQQKIEPLVQEIPQIDFLSVTQVHHDGDHKAMFSLLFLWEGDTEYQLHNSTDQVVGLLYSHAGLTERNATSTYIYRMPELINCTVVEYQRNEYTFEFNGSVMIGERKLDPGDYVIHNSTVHVCIVLLGDRGYGLTRDTGYVLTTMDIVTIVCCVISIIALIIRIILHFVLPSHSDRVASRLQLCLAVALLVAFTSFLLRIAAFFIDGFCYFLAVTLHWGFLAAFCWMTVIAIDIVRMLRNSLHLRKIGSRQKSFVVYSLFAWGASLLVVVLSIGLNHGQINPHWKPNYIDRCWISTRNALLVFFVLPAAILFLINIILFITSVCLLSIAQKDAVSMQVKLSRRRVTLHVNMLVLMGLTWVFGFLAGPLGQDWLWYIFIVLNALQGVLLLMLFLLSGAVRKLIKDRFSISRTTSSTTLSDSAKPGSRSGSITTSIG